MEGKKAKLTVNSDLVEWSTETDINIRTADYEHKTMRIYSICIYVYKLWKLSGKNVKVILS